MNGMTDYQLNSYLELLAQLVEAKAHNPAEAAGIIRSHKCDVGESAANDQEMCGMTDKQYRDMRNTLLRLCIEIVKGSDNKETAAERICGLIE